MKKIEDKKMMATAQINDEELEVIAAGDKAEGTNNYNINLRLMKKIILRIIERGKGNDDKKQSNIVVTERGAYGSW